LKKTSPSSNSKVSSSQREQYLYLTTHGRKSGLPREIEIWFTYHNRRLYVIAEYETSEWVRNLRANPTATVRVGKMTFPVAARILSSKAQSELERHVQNLSRKKYGWGDGLVIELVPEEYGSGINSED
jgi:deazaflavin-dependent oxidoreductase (nitroreductase family)